MPDAPRSRSRRPPFERGFRIIYELCLGSAGDKTHYPVRPRITPAMSRNEATVTPAPPQASTILASLGQAAFVWDIATDAIAWSDHAAAVFRRYSGGGAGQRRRVCQADRAGALDPVRRAGPSPPARSGDGAPYRIEYGVRASTSAPVLWIEESGCWFAGADGKPARAQGIVRINNERHARDEQLLKLSRHDPLTGELNRTHLVASLAEAIEEATRFRSSCAFMLIGIDHLARINDAFGFDVADAVISEVGQAHPRPAARRRRARPLLRQQVRADPEELHRRRHECRRRAVSGRHSRRGGADQIRPGFGHRLDRRGQRAALRAQRRRGDQPRPGNARYGEAPPRRIVFAVAAECRARRPAPRQYPRHRRDRHRAQRAPDRDGVRAGGGSALARGGVLRMPGPDGAG